MDWGSLIGGGVSQLLLQERSQNVNSAQAATQRQSEEREAAKAREFSSVEAATAREWSERMSGSAHQREVADLVKAGLNPILSGTGGMGSATPGASMASSAKANSALAAPAPDYGRAVYSALEARRNKAETDNLEMDTKLKLELKRAAHESIYGNYWKATLTQTENETEMARRDLTRNLIPGSNVERDIDLSAYGEGTRYLDRIGKTIGSAVGARRLMEPGLDPDPRPKYRGGPWRK